MNKFRNTVIFLALVAAILIGTPALSNAQETGDKNWGPEEKAIIDSFVTQTSAIDSDDQALFLTVTSPLVRFGQNEIPAETAFQVLKNMAETDPEEYRQAYDPVRIIEIRINGAQADFDLQDTNEGGIRNFTFVRDGGVWKWRGLQ